MASAITHFIVGVSAGLPAMRSKPVRRSMSGWAIPIAAGLFAVAPDLDSYVAAAMDAPRGSFYSHRGFFHSALFLAAFSTAAAFLAARRKPWRVIFALAGLWFAASFSHPLLDMLTDGGPGVMTFYPFSSERLFFPWRPIHVSPLSIAAFFRRAGHILWSELPFCAGALLLGVTGLVARRR